MNGNSLHGNKILAFITDFMYDIDTPVDFKILEAIYGNN